MFQKPLTLQILLKSQMAPSHGSSLSSATYQTAVRSPSKYLCGTPASEEFFFPHDPHTHPRTHPGAGIVLSAGDAAQIGGGLRMAWDCPSVMRPPRCRWRSELVISQRVIKVYKHACISIFITSGRPLKHALSVRHVLVKEWVMQNMVVSRGYVHKSSDAWGV